MKRFVTIIALITLSLIMQAQNRGDFLSFVDSFNWKISNEQFEEKYSSRILPKTDSLVTSFTYTYPFFVLDDLSIGEYDCITIVTFPEGTSSPLILSMIPDRVTKKFLQSVLSTKLDNILLGKLGVPDYRMDDVDLGQMGVEWLNGTQGSSKGWLSGNLALITINARNENGLIYMLVAQEGKPSLATEKNPIQDTFFGLTMGDRITSAQIKSAVGSRGVFNKETRESNTIINLFTDVYFAGNKWEFANFICTSDGKFYWFNAYNSYSDYSVDEGKDAKNQYEGLKRKLDEKYGAGNETTDNDGNLSTTYLGSNDMAIVISNERSKSLGGAYLRYVKIEYINLILYKNQTAENDDEL